MNLLFGISLDGAPSPSGWMEPGRLVCGPEGLLNTLEVTLGLPPVDGGTAIERLISYRETLQVQLERDPGAFYRRSFEVESLSTTRVFLRWRDELRLAGWDPKLVSEDSKPSRLATFNAVEEASSNEDAFRLGPAERLDRVLSALSEGLRSGIESIVVVDPPGTLPAKWRELLDRLEARYDENLPVEPLAVAGSQLHVLQARLLRISAVSGSEADGTVRLIEGRSEVDLARAIAQRGLEQGNSGKSALIASPVGRNRLNEFLGQRDLPLLGAQEDQSGGVLSQLLPLSLRLLWGPFDPQAWLEFLLHPEGPVPRGLRFRLARAIDAMPGRNNEEWRRAIERTREKSADDPDWASRIERAMSDWLELPEYSREKGAPIDVVIGVASRLAGWMHSVGVAKRSDEPEVAPGWLFTARAIESFARAIGRLERLTPQELERLLSLWLSTAEGGSRLRGELGGPETFSSPAQILEPFPVLSWWEPSESGVRRSPWTTRERSWLAEHGVKLVSAEALLEAEEKAGHRAVLQATESITIFVSTGEKGNRAAPIVTRIRAELDSTVDEDAAAAIPGEAIPVRCLPEPRRWWQLSDPSLLIPRESESFSSLSKAIESPYQWLLNYQGRLETGALFGFGVGDNAIRRGTLLHELAGKLLGPNLETGKPQEDWTAMSQPALQAWIDQVWLSVLAECGAQYLLSGYEAARNSLLHTARQALWRLVEHLQKASVTSVEVEKVVKGVPLGDGELNGRIDLVVSSPEATAVIDLKLGGRAKREAELKDNRHLQLAVYGHLLRETEGIDPNISFFIFGNAALLTRTKTFFPDAFPVSRTNEDDDSEWLGCWEEFLQVWNWRKAQFQTGLIEVTTGDTEPDRTPPLEHWATPEGADTYNDFDALTGWPRTA